MTGQAMAAESTSGKIVLHRPESGQANQVAMLPGQTYVLDFELDATTFDRQDADMRLNFEDGAILDLGGFFSAPETSDFTLELQDGTQLSGRDVVEALTRAIQDFHTDAAAPPPDCGAQAVAVADSAAPSRPEHEAEAPPHGHPHALSPSDAAGLLCHESCSLFDEDLSLPGSPDPLFDAPMTPLSRPAAHEGKTPLLNQGRPDEPLRFAELLDDGESLANYAPAAFAGPLAGHDPAAFASPLAVARLGTAPPFAREGTPGDTAPDSRPVAHQTPAVPHAAVSSPDHTLPPAAPAMDHAAAPDQSALPGSDQFFLDFLPLT